MWHIPYYYLNGTKALIVHIYTACTCMQRQFHRLSDPDYIDYRRSFGFAVKHPRNVYGSIHNTCKERPVSYCHTNPLLCNALLISCNEYAMPHHAQQSHEHNPTHTVAVAATSFVAHNFLFQFNILYLGGRTNVNVSLTCKWAKLLPLTDTNEQKKKIYIYLFSIRYWNGNWKSTLVIVTLFYWTRNGDQSTYYSVATATIDVQVQCVAVYSTHEVPCVASNSNNNNIGEKPHENLNNWFEYIYNIRGCCVCVLCWDEKYKKASQRNWKSTRYNENNKNTMNTIEEYRIPAEIVMKMEC